MNQVVQPPVRPATDSPISLTKLAHWIFSGLFLIAFSLVWLALWGVFGLTESAGWRDGVLVLTATITTLASLSRQLPGQNIILGAMVIAFIAAIVEGVGAATSLPFGPFAYTDEAGPRLLNMLAWPVPLIWVIAILNSRGVARLILRPWRKLRAYGFWLIGLTVVLTVLFDLSMEPFVTRVKHYWFWNPTRFPITWYGAPLVNFLGWLVSTLLILAFVTPALIDKRQRPAKRPPDYYPLVVWLLANALFATGAFTHRLWPAAGFSVTASILAAVSAIRGAMW
jgi:uncharacterized membrane protein